jgi:chromosome segregation ATPase
MSAQTQTLALTKLKNQDQIIEKALQNLEKTLNKNQDEFIEEALQRIYNENSELKAENEIMNKKIEFLMEYVTEQKEKLNTIETKLEKSNKDKEKYKKEINLIKYKLSLIGLIKI